MKSANKGTPGIEITVDLDEVKRGSAYEPMDKITRTLVVYFSKGGDHSWSLKKLRHAGWKGGGLDSLDLNGNRVEVIGKDEEYDGDVTEKFDLLFLRGEPAAEDGRRATATTKPDSRSTLSSRPLRPIWRILRRQRSRQRRDAVEQKPSGQIFETMSRSKGASLSPDCELL